MAREARQKGWWQAYGLGERFAYVGFETEAGLVRDFTPTYVPGLLQTAAYARALLVGTRVLRTDAEIENAVAVRTIRQERLTAAEDPLELVAILDEQVLHRPIGGPEVLRAQLDHLARATALPSVTLQVLPTALGAHPALASPFTVLSFGDLDEPDLAYVEHTLGAVYLEKAEDVARAILFFDQLRSEALGPTESVALIRRVAEELG